MHSRASAAQRPQKGDVLSHLICLRRQAVQASGDGRDMTLPPPSIVALLTACWRPRFEFEAVFDELPTTVQGAIQGKLAMAVIWKRRLEKPGHVIHCIHAASGFW